MSTLEDLQSRSSGEELAAICHLLHVVIGRVSPALLRKHWIESANILSTILEAHFTEGSVVKPVLGCLGPVLAAMEPANWPAAVKPFGMLLRVVLDSRPKVRKAAQSSLLEVLAGTRGTPAAASATDVIYKLCQQVLPGPAAAAQAAASATHKNRKAAEEVVQKAVADALHLIGTLKEVLPLLVGTGVTQICDLQVRLFPLRQPLLTRHAAGALGSVCAGAELRVGSGVLGELLRAVTEAVSSPESASSDALPSLLQLLESGFERLQEVDTGLCSTRLPAAVHALVPLLAAEQEGSRLAAARCLQGLIRTCIDSAAAAAAVTLARSRIGGAPSTVENVASALERSLGARYHDSWSQALPVVSGFFEAVGQAGAPLAGSLVARLGAMAGGAAEAADGESGPLESSSSESRSAINAAMGAALAHLGPEAVLNVLPLNLNDEGFSGRAEARTWLLPLMRQHVRGARLGYWGRSLLPNGRWLVGQAARVSQREGPVAQEQALQLRALEAQIWATLPAFARWPRDGAAGLMPHLAAVISAFSKRAELRASICAALTRLCSNPCQALKAAGEAGPLGFSGPGRQADEEGLADDVRDDQGLEPEDAADVPPYYTPELAQRDLAELRGRTAEVLTPLCDEFANAEPQHRGFIASAICEYAMVADPTVLHTIFKSVVSKYVSVFTTEGTGDGPPGKRDARSQQLCTLLDLALALAPGVNADGIKVLYKAAETTLQARDQALQKHGYKVLAYLCQQRPDFFSAHFQQLVDALMGGVATSLSAAKRFRLSCLQAVILKLQGPEPPPLELDTEDLDQSQEDARIQLIMTLLSEIILCVKEVNKRTRAAAFDLLVALAHAMEEADPAPAVPDLDTHMGGDDTPATGGRKGGLVTLFEMVLAGLAGTSPHMQSATVMALARLLFEFGGELELYLPRLLPAVILLSRLKSREVVKSVLGFLKVCAARLPVSLLESNMRDILAALLIWSEDTKNHFKLKVRQIVERLVRRCGYDGVAAKMPECEMKLLTHIRKETTRRAKRRREEGDGDDDEGKSTRSGVTARGGARTARRSEWAATSVFSEERGAGRHDARTLRTGATTARPSKAGGREAGPGGGATGRKFAGEEDEVMDLLDAGTSRRLVRAAAVPRGLSALDGDDGVDFPAGEGGRLVIRDDDRPQKRKRGDDLDGYDSADSDFDDIKKIRGARAAWKSTEHRSGTEASTRTRPGKGPSTSGKSAGRTSFGGRSSIAAAVSTKPQPAGGRAGHSSERFKSRKAGGDVKGSSRVEPYAYWPLDRKMLNRKRRGKQAVASKGLEKIVKGAKAGAAKGRKAKRQRT